MKRTLSLITALILAFALAMFAGCGESSESGKIPGNYKEPTEEQLNTALSSIDESKLFGDVTAEDWKFGIQANAGFSVNGEIGEEKIKISSDLSYLLAMAASEQGPSLKGSGKVSADASIPGEAGAEETKADIKFYNDSEFFYISATGIAEGQDEIKGKMSFEYILGQIGGMLPMVAEESDSETAIAPAFDIATLIASLEEYGIKVGLDTSNGVKIKLSATKETFDSVIEMIMGMIMGGVYTAAESEVPSFIEFTKSVLEIYIHIDKDGKFVAVEANADIAVSVDLSALGMLAAEGSEETKATFSVKGIVSVKASSKTVTLSGDLDTYPDLEQGGTEIPMAA